jgi:hypothetical protein
MKIFPVFLNFPSEIKTLLNYLYDYKRNAGRNNKRIRRL